MKLNNKSMARIYRISCMVVILTVLLSCAAFAASTDPVLAPLNRLKDMVRGVVTIGGGLVALWGIVQLGLTLQSHDASQRGTGILIAIGGIIIALAPKIIDWITA